MKKLENTLLQITQNGMGSGDETLGLQLAVNYLKLIVEQNRIPKFITLYNAGVKLICSGSPAIEAFKEIEGRGVKIIACKTCLNHFGLLDNMEVGITGSMVDIIELQGLAQKVVNL
jgi:intracellular sulfur oxidation DsrE/DsrF family protein